MNYVDSPYNLKLKKLDQRNAVYDMIKIEATETEKHFRKTYKYTPQKQIKTPKIQQSEKQLRLEQFMKKEKEREQKEHQEQEEKQRRLDELKHVFQETPKNQSNLLINRNSKLTASNTLNNQQNQLSKEDIQQQQKQIMQQIQQLQQQQLKLQQLSDSRTLSSQLQFQSPQSAILPISNQNEKIDELFENIKNDQRIVQQQQIQTKLQDQLLEIKNDNSQPFALITETPCLNVLNELILSQIPPNNDDISQILQNKDNLNQTQRVIDESLQKVEDVPNIILTAKNKVYKGRRNCNVLNYNQMQQLNKDLMTQNNDLTAQTNNLNTQSNNLTNTNPEVNVNHYKSNVLKTESPQFNTNLIYDDFESNSNTTNLNLTKLDSTVLKSEYNCTQQNKQVQQRSLSAGKQKQQQNQIQQHNQITRPQSSNFYQQPQFRQRPQTADRFNKGEDNSMLSFLQKQQNQQRPSTQMQFRQQKPQNFRKNAFKCQQIPDQYLDLQKDNKFIFIVPENLNKTFELALDLLNQNLTTKIDQQFNNCQKYVNNDNIQQNQYFLDLSQNQSQNEGDSCKNLQETFTLIWQYKELVSLNHIKLLKNGEFINHFPGISIVSNKASFARHALQVKSKLLLQTFNLPGQFNQLCQIYNKDKSQIFIVKPTNLSRGREITIARSPLDITYNRLSIAQIYIQNPLLYNNRKCDFRCYMLIKGGSQLKYYLYKEGICRVSPYLYDINDNRIETHITNTSVSKNVNNRSRLLITQSFNQFNSDIQQNFYENALKCADLIFKILTKTESVTDQNKFSNHQQCFELIGFDMILDQKNNAYLIEANASPSLFCDCPMDFSLKPYLIHDIIQLLANNQEIINLKWIQGDFPQEIVELK